MTRIPEQAVEAALEAWYTTPTNYVFETKADGDAKQMLAALTAALPHPLPTASQSDEDRAREIAEHAGIDMMDDHDLFIAEMATALAEATAAEREACARVADDYARWGEHNQPAQIPAREIAAAIRGRK